MADFASFLHLFENIGSLFSHLSIHDSSERCLLSHQVCLLFSTNAIEVLANGLQKNKFLLLVLLILFVGADGIAILSGPHLFLDILCQLPR